MKLLSSYDENTLYCFSPTVMLITLIIEFVSAIYVLIISKLKPSSAILISILICLGTFQLAEYQVCSNRSLLWMRIGYVAITLLPPLGAHLISLVTKQVWYKYLGYVLGVVFVGVFLISARQIQTAVCEGNYVMVTTASNFISRYFSYYYYLILVIALLNISGFLNSQKDKSTRDLLKTSFLFWITLGYVSFLVPTGAVWLLSQSARSGIPSIMCGFAVFLALILVFRVYPISRKLNI